MLLVCAAATAPFLHSLLSSSSSSTAAFSVSKTPLKNKNTEGKASLSAHQRGVPLAIAVEQGDGREKNKYVIETQQRQQTKGVFALAYLPKGVIPTLQEGLLYALALESNMACKACQ